MNNDLAYWAVYEDLPKQNVGYDMVTVVQLITSVVRLMLQNKKLKLVKYFPYKLICSF